MNDTEEYVLIAPCGLSCGHCPAYLSKDNPAIMEYLITMGSNREDLPCQGCRPLEGKPGWCRNVNRSQVVEDTREPVLDVPADDSPCATYTCSAEHGVDFCYECPEFPCVKLQPCADMATALPQNLKVFNLWCLKRQGPAEWLKNRDETSNVYFFGKLVLGNGPQITEDGLRAIQESQDQLQHNVESKDQEQQT